MNKFGYILATVFCALFTGCCSMAGGGGAAIWVYYQGKLASTDPASIAQASVYPSNRDIYLADDGKPHTKSIYKVDYAIDPIIPRPDGKFIFRLLTPDRSNCDDVPAFWSSGPIHLMVLKAGGSSKQFESSQAEIKQFKSISFAEADTAKEESDEMGVYLLPSSFQID